MMVRQSGLCATHFLHALDALGVGLWPAVDAFDGVDCQQGLDGPRVPKKWPPRLPIMG